MDLSFVPPEQLDRVRGSPGARLLDFPNSAWTQIAWNTRR